MFNGKERGFSLAFAISAYDSEPNPIEDPRYGYVNAQYVTWGLNKDSQGGVDPDKLTHHLCSKEELGLIAGDSNFYPVHPNSERDVTFYSPKLRCFDKDLEL